MRAILFLLIGGLLLWWLTSIFYTVDRAEYAYVTEFGKPIATFDGETEAGLHFKLPWPIQSVLRVDHRLQVFDLPPTDVVTPDQKENTIGQRLSVDAYVCWRIAGTEDKQNVDRFLRTVGSPERARSLLGQRVTSRLSTEISKMELKELISIASPEAVQQRMDQLGQRLLGLQDDGNQGTKEDPNGLRAEARKDFGIELVEVRLRRYNHPIGVRSAIHDRIRAERDKMVADFKSDGETRASKIKSDADLEASKRLADARKKEIQRKAEADKLAYALLNQAQSQDVEFFQFLGKLEMYKESLGKTKDVLLLSTRHELFDLLLKPPRPNGSANPMAGMPPVNGKSGGP